MTKILVTGCSGFIASHMVPYLRDQGHAVFGIDLVPPADGLALSRFVCGDIREPLHMREAVRGSECVINLAAKHHDFGISEAEYLETNEGGSRIVLAAMAEANISRYVFFSSVAVYGTAGPNPNEDTVPCPSSPYGASKLAGERVAEEWARADSSREVVILRPTVVFGERNLANMYSLIRQIDRGRYIQCGKGNNVKSVAYVGNVVRAMHHAMRLAQNGVNRFNYVDQPDLPVSEIVAVIAKALGTRTPRLRMPLSVGVLGGSVFDLIAAATGRHFRVSAARVRKLAMTTRFQAAKIRSLGYEQTFSIEEGLRRMVQWYQQGSQGGMEGGG